MKKNYYNLIERIQLLVLIDAKAAREDNIELPLQNMRRTINYLPFFPPFFLPPLVFEVCFFAITDLSFRMGLLPAYPHRSLISMTMRILERLYLKAMEGICKKPIRFVLNRD